MALDSRFVAASDLQTLLRDKDTGLPLRNGVIYFWQDAARSIPKDVYKISGTPPNYIYTNIGSQVTLTAAGTMSDNENPANDIILYYFPYEGTPDPDGSDGTTELYFVQVYSEGGVSEGVLQFTREAWPPNVENTQSNTQTLINYIPNGQFKIHSDVEVNPDTPNTVPGQISQPVTTLAQGGWTFERPNASTATDIVLFEPFGGFVANPTASPTYYLQIENTSPSAGDSFKDLRIKFDDVNKFASDTQEYTFAFSGQSNAGNVNASLVLIKNYGDGGDPEEQISLANFIITNSFTVIQKSGFLFGINEGSAIGDGSYIQLALRFPTGSLFSVSLTDFILTSNNITVTEFPQTTDREFAAQSITPAIPAYDNSELYLPVRLGPEGLLYDDSEIGEVVTESNLSMYVDSLHPTSNKMLADGSQYETAGFSPLGIPFARLQAKYWDDNLNLPIYGTGASYFLASGVNSANQIVLSNNSAGVVTATTDGSTPTGFTFSTVHTAIAPASGYFCKSVQNREDGFLIINDEPGDTGADNAGTAPVTVSQFRVGSVNPDIAAISAFAINSPIGPGQYFTFQTSNGGVVFFYMWFQVDGTGADPAIPGRTGILVNLHGGDDIVTNAKKITMALNDWQATRIQTVAASAITAGAFFAANAITSGGTIIPYYVWYKKDGVGTDPAPSDKTGIEVDILTADTDAQVAQKTQIAINQKFFAAPDYRGQFFRGWSNGSSVDPAEFNRYSYTIGIIGDSIGTQEFDDFLFHSHDYSSVSTGTGELAGGSDTSIVFTETPTTSTGGSEVRPINIYVNYAIRY